MGHAYGCMNTTIGIVDDHKLFLKSVSLLIESFRIYEVTLEAEDGLDLQRKIVRMKSPPEIIFVDMNMPNYNGVETSRWLSANYPAIKLIALSMNNSDRSIIDMIKAGCCSYLIKDTHPSEFEKALAEVNAKGYYNGDATNTRFRRLLETEETIRSNSLSDKELAFIKLACSDLTYKQIAFEMKCSERTVDGYRENLFRKLKVQSRVGLAMEAIRQDLMQL